MHLIIRADANTAIGTGHLMRCLALAQAWQEQGGEVTFITACDSESLCQRLLDEGFNLVKLKAAYPDPVDWSETSQTIKSSVGSWIVLDGYHFDPVYQKSIKDLGCRLLVIDDMAHLDHYYADIILNQNISAEEKSYSCEPYTEQLLGTKYVLLRREFWQWQNWQREIPPVAQKILVTMGGGDPDNVTLKVLQALEQVDLKDLKVNVVVGAANPNYEKLDQFAAQSRHQINLNTNVENMPELMAWADLAISAGGSTCWELAYMGLPFMVITLASNQLNKPQKRNTCNTFYFIGWHEQVSSSEMATKTEELLFSYNKRSQVSFKAKRMIDGLGFKRVISAMRKNSISLLLADKNDCELVWFLSNGPEARDNSFSSELIEWEDHQQWYMKKIKDNNSTIFIAKLGGNKILGVIRFDKNNSEVVISVAISDEYRGKGFGSALIELGSDEILRNNEVNAVKAYVKPSNKNSVKAFLNAGFEIEDYILINEQEAVMLSLWRTS